MDGFVIRGADGKFFTRFSTHSYEENYYEKGDCQWTPDVEKAMFFDSLAQAQIVIKAITGAVIVPAADLSAKISLKEYQSDDTGGVCPECGSHNKATEGTSYSGYEGSFYYCPVCSKPSILIHVGATFTIGEPFKACTVYEIEAIHPTVNMITCGEIAKVHCSALSKPNKNHCTYFSREHILSAMSGHFREDL